MGPRSPNAATAAPVASPAKPHPLALQCTDANGDGLLTFEEACAAALPGCAGALQDEDKGALHMLRASFAAYDVNADGYLSRAEFDSDLEM
ncbi:frequenin-1 [Micractinium conductrix]|uniref:Frequenin-1 n=1 Tax=Micractinium conductrix TaxID=554055 RepID=A0A2P6VKP9_9CHLO|nr:frequenin-1 [Micractinium conductrix]|eukprot:PSC74676.1 frequenin-1 [Micractinium conductrix]